MWRIGGLWVTLLALLAAHVGFAVGPVGEPERIGRPQAFAWLGGWDHVRSPGVAAPDTNGTAEGTLEDTFRVEWQRDGDTLTARFTGIGEAWCGRLGVEVPCGSGVDAVVIGYNDLPVRVPLADLRPGQVWWTWHIGVPRWLYGEFPTERPGASSLLLRTQHHHGCFLLRRGDGTAVVQLCLDWPQVGESVEMAFDLVWEADVPRLQAAARARLGIGPDPPLDREAARRLRARGFVRVDQDGWAFKIPAGRPYYPLGRNLPHLPTFSPAEQEALLDRVVAARMNTVRFLLPCDTFRPVPGVWNETALERLRESLDRCAARGVRVILCLEYSAAGYQYNCSLHISPSPGDLYLLDETLTWYAGMIDRVVRPLRDDPAIFAWDVTNEPFLDPDPQSQVLRPAFRAWLCDRYRTADALRAAWGEEVESFEAASLPDPPTYEAQSTPAARDFFAFAQAALAESMIRRARLVRAADPHHLLTVSAWNPRLLRGHEDAELFDFWTPHTYDLWVNGPVIDQHVALLVHGLRQALPDRPRPVMVEEFGIDARPPFPESMRTEHVRQFLAAGRRHGLAGLLHWWEMTPAMDAAYAETQPYHLTGPPDGPTLAVYLPPSQEWNLIFYNRYMARRQWAEALTRVMEAGYRPRFVGSASEAEGAKAVLVLGDRLTEEETEEVRRMGLPTMVP